MSPVLSFCFSLFSRSVRCLFLPSFSFSLSYHGSPVSLSLSLPALSCPCQPRFWLLTSVSRLPHTDLHGKGQSEALYCWPCPCLCRGTLPTPCRRSLAPLPLLFFQSLLQVVQCIFMPTVDSLPLLSHRRVRRKTTILSHSGCSDNSSWLHKRYRVD